MSSFWLVITLLSAGSLVLRTAPLLAHGNIRTPPIVERLLKRVPTVALTALAVPGALYLKDAASYDLSPIRILAALVGLAVALKTKSMLATLAAGMIALWALQAVF